MSLSPSRTLWLVMVALGRAAATVAVLSALICVAGYLAGVGWLARVGFVLLQLGAAGFLFAVVVGSIAKRRADRMEASRLGR